MKHTSLFFAVALASCAVFGSSPANAQSRGSPPRFPPGGFDRPLSSVPLRGNPGGSPKLTMVEFKALLAHWRDYDANKNQRFDKAEAPEFFAKLFDEADASHDGALDERELSALGIQNAADSKTASVPKPAQNNSPGRDRLDAFLFGDPVFGAPPIPKPAR